MKLDNYICYTKDDKIYSLGMELDSNILQEKFTGGGLTKSFLRKKLGIPLSLFLINNKKSFFDDFVNEDNIKKKQKIKPKCITYDLFNKLINLRANPILKKKKTKKHRKKKQRKTKKNLFIF
jgi:topoisomerase IA-like protein